MFSWHRFRDLFVLNRVVIYADFIDPFCYIGFHNLRQAAELSKTTLEWRGFEFNPETPPEGFELQTAANSDLRPGMWASVREYASQSGLSFSEPQKVPNTRLTHGLVALVTDPKAKNPLIERIYQAYFNLNRDIGSASFLVELAKDFGMNEAFVRQGLENPRFHEKLEAYREEAKARAFLGMPAFLFRGRPHFGALSQSAWREIFTQKPTTTKETVCSTK